MEEEIDLRPYIELLIRRWYFIVGAALLAGIIAFAFTSLQDDVYEATALIAVTQDRLIARFDPRLDTSDEPQPIKALPEFATSDAILNSVLESLDPPLADISSINGLRKIMEAAAGSDPSLIKLSTASTDPGDAARVSNLWAEVFVAKANEVFGDSDGNQLIFFEDQLDQAEKELATAEADLVTFQGINRQALLTNILEALDLSQDQYLAERQELNQLKSNVADLSAQISGPNGTGDISFADQLTALILQLRAYNPAMVLPIQIQIGGTDEFAAADMADQVAVLEGLHSSITSRSAAVEVELAALEPQLLSSQKELQEAQAEYNRLTLNRDVAQETYLSLARKVDEERITADDATRGIRLASQAAVPDRTTGSGRLLKTAAAAAVAFVLVIALIIVIEWWQGGREQE